MLEENQTFAHFKIIKKLGAGGMGEVYLAEDSKLNRKVALKVLLADYFDNPEHLERFNREARTAAQISHPNVMSIYDIGSATDEASGREIRYIVMEYLEGDQLSSYLQTKTPDMAIVVRLAEKIASGLAAAHRLNIVHRDIKAENIIIDNSGEPKILDFGLAKPLDSFLAGGAKNGTQTVSQELTRAGKIMGTVSYMSPEQAKGETVDIRSDIFSFGVLLYRMTTGEMPFSGPSKVSTLAKILESRHESPRSKNENMPPELERLIDKCLQKNPDDRYQDTRDLVVDLRNLRRQYDSGVTDSITGVTQQATATRTTVYKMGGKQLVAMAAIVIVGVAAVLYFLNRGDSPGSSGVVASENSLAVLGFENKTGDEELDWLETGLPEIMLTDLAQSDAIELISRERILDCFDDRDTVHSHEEYVKAARSLGAVSLLSGAFYKFGESLRIDARLEDLATGKIILAEKVVGDSPFQMVDSLTAKIAASLDINESMSSDRSVATLTSSSPEAYKLYLAGLDKFGKELYDDAISELEKAVAIDTNFALAYLRIGMAYQFQGRPQQGKPYIAQANEKRDNLPVREKSVVDIYSNVWLFENFDEAFVKIKTFVSNYPDDKELRTIYALFLDLFIRDTVQTFAQFDTVLRIDPQYQLAISQYASRCQQNGNYEKAMTLVDQLLTFHPDSPTGYRLKTGLYVREGKYDDAIQMQEKLLEIFPDDADAFETLSDLHIRNREFDKARQWADRIKEKYGDDSYRMFTYYISLANLENWNGRFLKSKEYRLLGLNEALETRDSAYITAAYNNVSGHLFRMGYADSSMHYARKGFKWASDVQKLNFPLSIVSKFPNMADIVRPVFAKALESFKARIPSEYWAVTDAATKIFNARCDADTAAIIKGLEELADLQPLSSTDGRRTMAYLMIETGRFDEGLGLLQEIHTDPNESLNAYRYNSESYYLGRALEGLGNEQEAIEHYEAVLQFWGNPDLEIDRIEDTRRRLIKLTT